MGFSVLLHCYIYLYIDINKERGKCVCVCIWICVRISRNICNICNILYSIRVCGVTKGVTKRYKGTKTALCSTLDPNLSGFLLAYAPGTRRN